MMYCPNIDKYWKGGLLDFSAPFPEGIRGDNAILTRLWQRSNPRRDCNGAQWQSKISQIWKILARHSSWMAPFSLSFFAFGFPLAPLKQPVAQEVIQFRDGKNLQSGGLGIIFDASKFNLVFVQHDITASRIAIARLTNASYVNHQFLVAQRVRVADFPGRIKPEILGKHAWHVRMSLKTVFLNKAENTLDFALVIYVLGKNVLI